MQMQMVFDDVQGVLNDDVGWRRALIGQKEVGQKWINFWPLSKISTD